MTEARANTNLHHLAGVEVTSRPDNARYAEYRRQWMENPRTGTVAPFPLFLDLEMTSVCNLRCPFCATTYRGRLISKGFMAEELVRAIIDEGAGQGLYGVKFNIRGEPLLHPGIARCVAYAKQRGLLDVYFNTNAMLLDATMADRLIDAGLDRLSVSAEGYTAEVYERYRVGASFAVLRRNLEAFLRVRAARGSTTPALRVQSVAVPELLADRDGYVAFWRQYADEVAYLDYKEMKERRRGVVAAWSCPQLWQRLGVFWDGTVIPCNHDDDAALRLGNAATDGIRACWLSPRLQKVRALHRAGKAHTLPACDGCYLRASEIGKETPAS